MEEFKGTMVNVREAMHKNFLRDSASPGLITLYFLSQQMK